MRLNTYQYERGDGRTKHCWNQPYAGFVPGGRGDVGKCANSITDGTAKTLLNCGVVIPYGEVDVDPGYPERVFNVHSGEIYVAVPTRPGVSYHGYPYRGPLPKATLKELEAISNAEGTLGTFRKWVNKYIKAR